MGDLPPIVPKPEGSPKAIVGASMRKLVHLIYGVIKSGMPFNAEIAMNGLDHQEGI